MRRPPTIGAAIVITGTIALVLLLSGNATSFTVTLVQAGQQPVRSESDPLTQVERKAEEGDIGAQSQLCRETALRDGFAAASRWCRMAAEAGDPIGQGILGVQWWNGWDAPQDYEGAVRWFRLAAEQNYPQAQALLAFAYRSGQGVPQDSVEAYKWLNLYLAQTPAELAQEWIAVRNEWAALMTAEQVADAQRRAREWSEAFEKRKRIAKSCQGSDDGPRGHEPQPPAYVCSSSAGARRPVSHRPITPRAAPVP